jgi:hypothetical protein
LRVENRNRTRRTYDIRQRNVRRHDATPMTLRFCSYMTQTPVTILVLNLGRRSETGREKRVTLEFGERKEEKILPQIQGVTIPVLNKEKGKDPMASSPQRNHAFIYDRKIVSRSHYNKSYVHAAYDSHAMFASSSTFVRGTSRPRRNHVGYHVPRRMCNGPSTVYHTCNTSFILSCKNTKVVAKKVGSKCKEDKTCIWVPKVIVTNLVGPNKSWVPKTQE